MQYIRRTVRNKVMDKVVTALSPMLGWSILFFYIGYALKYIILKVMNLPLDTMRAFHLAPPKELITTTPEERFMKADLNGQGYNFEPHYLVINNIRMHYIDEGAWPAGARADSLERSSTAAKQQTIFMIHGEPSWSFQFRKMVPILTRAGYRVICPDLIGFGKSDKLTRMDAYSVDLLTGGVMALIEQLDLNNITLVVHGWGGFTGLNSLRYPVINDRVSSLVVINTSLPGTLTNSVSSNAGARQWLSFLWQMRSQWQNLLAFMVWRSFVLFAGTFLPVGWVVNSTYPKMSREVRQCYEAPFHSPESKAGAAQLPLLVPILPWSTEAAQNQAIQDVLSKWSKPAMLLFSEMDILTKGWDKKLANMFLRAPLTQVKIKDAGHLVEEEKGEEVAEHIANFIQRRAGAVRVDY